MNNEKKKGILEEAVFVLGCIIFYATVVTIVLTFTDFREAVNGIMGKSTVETSKVVLYEGPKSLKDADADDLKAASENLSDISLKHCVDTQITVNGADCFVYDTCVNNTHTWDSSYSPSLERTPIAYFDFEGKVEITVTVPDTDIETVTVRPLAYGIEPKISNDGHSVTFTVDTPDSYTVEWNGSVKRAVHIFANALLEDVPDLDDPDVKYIGPGEWDIGDIVLESGQTLYIAGGAVVHGTVCANYAQNVTVMGRGIIDGSTYAGWKGHSAHVPLVFNNCQYITVSDIICLNSNAWGLQAYDVVGGEIDGLKMITARPNGDGLSLQSCKSMKVRNCFVRTWDDSLVVKNYDVNSSNITFDNIQVWTDLAQSMEIGYETNKGKKTDSTITDVTFSNITVLHNFHKPVLSIHNADDADVSDITYKNIVVEDAAMGRGDGVNTLIDIEVLYNSGWSSTSERGSIENVTIDGFTVLDGNASTKCVISGFDSGHMVKGVTISDFTYKGTKIQDAGDSIFSIDEKTTSGISVE